jgi:hypothetical protein
VVQEIGGRVLYSWNAEDGWQDSGWVRDIDIPYESVYVQVLYYRGDGSPPIEMKMLNPAPGTPYGWLSRGQCHALEVEWPEEIAADATPGITPVPAEGSAPQLGNVPADNEDGGGAGSGGMGGG